jgi:hypothetical protein
MCEGTRRVDVISKAHITKYKIQIQGVDGDLRENMFLSAREKGVSYQQLE